MGRVSRGMTAIAGTIHEISKFILKSCFVRSALVELADRFFVAKYKRFDSVHICSGAKPMRLDNEKEIKSHHGRRFLSGHSDYARQVP